MPENETALNYLRDLGYIIRETAVEVHRLSERLRAEGNRDEFEIGRAHAYYEVASLMAMQAESFGLDPSALAFDGFEPDRDLLGPPPAAVSEPG